MTNVRIEALGPCRKDLHISVPAADVTGAFHDVLSAYAKAARVPGFRPGRAPADVVRRKFAKEIVQDVKERLLPRGYQEAIRQEKVDAVSVLQVNEGNLQDGQPFDFTVTVDVAPDFNLPVYKGIQLQGQAIVVEPPDIDGVVQNMRENQARYEEVSGRPAQEGDLLQVDFEGVVEGHPILEIAPKAAAVAQGKDFWVVLDRQNELIPGFTDGLLGCQIGEKRQVLVDFPQDFAETQLAGRKATYFVDMKALRQKVLPELTEEFLKSMGAESLEKLRARVEAELKAVREAREKGRLQGEIVKYLLMNTAMEVPESVLQEETRHAVHDLVEESSYRGVSREDMESRKNEIIDVATRNATERVKVRYILTRIADEEKIESTEQDVAARLHDLARRYGKPPEKVREDLEGAGRLDDVAHEIRMNKALKWLVEQANVAAP
jgi:trigger factor